MSTISIGEYILNRIKELCIDTVFGVPGDFNMPLLDLIDYDSELVWCSSANELNASYAADGYSRVRGISALVTSFGLGELSSMNGLAGSYSEMVPVIHIVGTPRTIVSDSSVTQSHAVGNGDYDIFYKMSSMISAASTNVTLVDAIEEIDRVIQTAVINKRPGYIGIPINLIHARVEVPKIIPLQLSSPKNPEELQSVALKQILKEIKAAKYPIVIVDGCILRHGLEIEVNKFVERSGFPTFSAPMGKGSVNTELANYRGIYCCDEVSLSGIEAEIQKADLLIEIGSIKADFNTGHFSFGPERTKTISLNSRITIIYHAEYPGVGMHELLPLVTASLPTEKAQFEYSPRIRPNPIDASMNEITHNYLWNKVPEYVGPNNIIVGEIGSSEIALFNMECPKNTIFISQILWVSTGYSVSAAVGAAMADRSRKVYLFVSNDAFLVTAQEIEVFIRQGLTPVICLLKNNNYRTEKLVHGPYCMYNNFKMWEYSRSLNFSGGNTNENKATGRKHAIVGIEAKVNTPQEFESAMKKITQQTDKIHFLEIVMPRTEDSCDSSLITDP
ncbi:pyruvate decarboxylase isozyme [Thamnidium elegans]|nr:pyruvate decarboxylase isozyme [Thamnidium elegans]